MHSEAPVPVDPPPPWRTIPEWVLGFGVLGGFLVGVVVLAMSCHDQTFAAADAFFVALREGRTQAAWEGLAVERRRELGLGAFEVAVSDPVYAGHTDSGFGSAVSWGPVDGRYHACAAGSLTHEGESWYAEVYLTQSPEDEDWQVHSWGVQEPARMATTLLEPCRSAW